MEETLARFKVVTKVADDQYTALCPSHADSNPSLSIGVGQNGKLLLHCHRGCDFDDIRVAAGLNQWDVQARHTKKQPVNAKPKVDHQPTPKRKPATPRLKTAEGAKEDWAAKARKFSKALNEAPKLQKKIACKLGIPFAALQKIQMGTTHINGEIVFTFPEYDGFGLVIGIGIRELDGKKRFLKGGHRGLTLPAGWSDSTLPVILVEGPTDTAALTAMGLPAVGRPSASGGYEHLLDLLDPLPATKDIFVMGENDPKPDGSWPGAEGAKRLAGKLADALERPIYFSLPPGQKKDVREWYFQQGATHE